MSDNMLDLTVFYQNTSNAKEGAGDLFDKPEFMAEALSQLYQIEILQPLDKLKRQVLQTLSSFMAIDSVIWHSQLEQDILDKQALLTQYAIDDNDITLFDIKLEDSNVHHYFILSFNQQLCEVQVANCKQSLSMFLPLIAEIYRQTVIHSYYRKWKRLPFLQSHKELTMITNSKPFIDDMLDKVNSHDVYFEEQWEEYKNSKRAVLIRIKRVENQLFVDKFILPESIQELTKKQKQICFYLKACFSNQEIADTLGISIKTVGNHLTAIYEKLNVSRSQLFQLLNTVD